MEPSASRVVWVLVRWACLSLLVACAAPPGGWRAAELARTPTAPTSAPVSAPAPTPVSAPVAPAAPAAPAAPVLPTFAKPGELYVVTVAGPTARCEAWTIDPARRVMISKQDARELDFEVSGRILAVTGLAFTQGDLAGSTTSCNLRGEARETDQAIVIDGAKLFRTADECAAAVEHHARVATTFDCGSFEEPPERVQRATRAKLEGMLARGGTLYSIVDAPGGDTCETVRVRARKASDRGSLEGSLEYDEVSADGVKGTTSYGYQMQRGATRISLLGPSATFRDGSGWSLG